MACGVQNAYPRPGRVEQETRLEPRTTTAEVGPADDGGRTGTGATRDPDNGPATSGREPTGDTNRVASRTTPDQDGRRHQRQARSSRPKAAAGVQRGNRYVLRLGYRRAEQGDAQERSTDQGGAPGERTRHAARRGETAGTRADVHRSLIRKQRNGREDRTRQGKTIPATRPQGRRAERSEEEEPRWIPRSASS